MTNIDDHTKLASLMAAGRGIQQGPYDHSWSQASVPRKARIVALLGALGVVGTAAGLQIKDVIVREATLDSLRKEAPETPPAPLSSLGLNEKIPVRRYGTPLINSEFAKSYLSSLLELSQKQEVIAVQNEYRHFRDENGNRIPNNHVRNLQAVVLGSAYADGLLGDFTASRFRRILEKANQQRLPFDIIDLGNPNQPLKLTVEMAEELVLWAERTNSEARKEFQRALETNGFSVGRAGIDGNIGSDTKSAISAFQQSRGIAEGSASLYAATLLAVVEGRPDFRADVSAIIVKASWYHDLPDGWKDRLVKMIGESDLKTLAVFNELITSPGFCALHDQKLCDLGLQESANRGRATSLRCELFAVYDALGIRGKCHLVNLCHRMSIRNSSPVLFETDGELDETGNYRLLLDYLYDIAVDELRPADEPYREEILCSVIEELDPFNINQGPWARCGVDVCDFDFSLRYPALAARLSAAAFLQHGSYTDKEGRRYDVDTEDGYSEFSGISRNEARKHLLLMRAHDGTGKRYNTAKDRWDNPLTGERVGQGMPADETAQIMIRFTGEEHLVYQPKDGMSSEAIALLLRQCSPGDKFSYISRFLTEVEISELSRQEREGLGPYPRSAHIVNVVCFDPELEEVHFRTWGEAPAPAGSVIPAHNGSIPMRVIDQHRGIYAVALRELAPRLTSVIMRAREDLPRPEDLDEPLFGRFR